MTVTSTAHWFKEAEVVGIGQFAKWCTDECGCELSSDDMRVECLLDRFQRARVANKSNDPLLSRIAGWVPDEQFLDVAGLDGPARCRVAYDLSNLVQSHNDGHIAETVSQPKTAATRSRVGLILGLLFDMSRSCWELDVQANAERQCEYLRTERPVLSVGSLKCRVFMDLRSMDRGDPQFSKTLEAGLSHLKWLMEICHWQNQHGRWFLHEDPHHSWSQNTKTLRTLGFLSGVRVTKTKQLGAFIPIVLRLLRSLNQVLQILERRQILFATSVLRGLRQTLEEVTRAIDRSWTDCGRGMPCAEACR